MNVLITGKTSRIGNSLARHLEGAGGYTVDIISMRGNWKETDLSRYDAVVHAAAIAHQKEEPGQEDLYMQVNAHMADELAKMAKDAGVGLFVFLSTMGVYGVNGSLREMVVIDENTPINPDNLYGKSKFEAERLIEPLADDRFKVSSLRAPLVYGRDCRGNYARFQQLANKMPVMPRIDNQRSMIYVGNLCEFIRLLLDEPRSGTFFPQNREYVNTSEMLRYIAEAQGKKMRFSGLMGSVVKGLMANSMTVKKVYGNLVYDKALSDTFGFKYCTTDFEQSFRD